MKNKAIMNKAAMNILVHDLLVDIDSHFSWSKMLGHRTGEYSV